MFRCLWSLREPMPGLPEVMAEVGDEFIPCHQACPGGIVRGLMGVPEKPGMKNASRWCALLAMKSVVCLVITQAAAEVQVVYQTNPPGGFFGPIGFDVSTSQSVAVRFMPAADVRLHAVRAYFMNNNFDPEAPRPLVTLTIQTDTDPPGQYTSAPSGIILETLPLTVTAVGWDPIQDSVDSVVRPVLSAGVRYWVVAESSQPPGDNPVWVWAGEDLGFNGNTDQGLWQTGLGAVVSIRVEGTPVSSVCNLADITGIGGPPAIPDGLLTGDDFNAFISAFAAGELLADVTGIGGPPAIPDGLITGDDFNAFIAAFAQGCP